MLIIQEGVNILQSYKAKIVGFKWNRNRIWQYYPIYEYVNEYGETKRYVRRHGIERTPFLMSQKHRIYKRNGKSYEESERKLNIHFTMLLFKMLTIVALFIYPKYALWITLFSLCVNAIYQCTPFFKRYTYHVAKNRGIKVSGKIVGTQRVKDKSVIDNKQYVYRPIIEYIYGDSIYTHLSNIKNEKDIYVLNGPCDIFIDKKSQCVVDEMEAMLPIIDIDQINFYLTKLIQKAKSDNTKVYIPKAQPIGNAVFVAQKMTSDTIPLNIPLKDIRIPQKAANW